MSTVLIVDDDLNITSSLTHFLTDEGFNVLIAENPYDAYNIAIENMPDIIISDIHMPGMDGFEFRNKLKDNPKTSSIPLVFLTADSTACENKNAFSIPSNRFITKPFMFEDILKAINVYPIGHIK
jgi:DNA-binding response OmpR family regulator